MSIRYGLGQHIWDLDFQQSLLSFKVVYDMMYIIER